MALLQTLSAAGQLIDIATRILRRLTKAYQNQKDLARSLRRYTSELESVKTVIGVLEDEETLQTALVSAEAQRLKEIEGKLVQHLKKLDMAPRGSLKEFTHQFIHGSFDERKLAAIMEELIQVKIALVLHIQVANVGVIRTVGNQLVANAEAVHCIDRFVKNELGEGVELKIARLLKGRRPSSMFPRNMTKQEDSS